jgi:hypothetical protein
MTDEGKRPVADLASEIMSADRASTPSKDEARNNTLGDYLIWAFIGMMVLALLTALVVIGHSSN